VDEHERKRLLERVDRDGATVGASIPETIEADGERLPLREAVLDPDAADVSVPELKVALRRARTERYERLEAGDVSVSEGERIADEIVGIDRARDVLGSSTDDLEAEAERQAAMDRKRWLSFLRRALGHEDDESGVGARPPTGEP
jgi:hypothetical protein